MSNFCIDIAEFASKLKEESSKSTLVKEAGIARTVPCSVTRAENEDKFVKVGFDLYRTDPNFVDDREFWKISEDGQNFIRVFSEDEHSAPAVNETPWTVANDDSRIRLAYHGTTVATLPLDKFNVKSPNDLVNLQGLLINKASSNPGFAVRAMREFSPDREKFLRNEYPELFAD